MSNYLGCRKMFDVDRRLMPQNFAHIDAIMDGLMSFPSAVSKYFDGSFKVDIKNNETEYVVDAELPGVLKEDISIEMKEGILTIEVSKKEEVEEKKENYMRKERSSFSSIRQFELDGVNEDAIKASFDNGVLNISLPKCEKKDNKKVISIL